MDTAAGSTSATATSSIQREEESGPKGATEEPVFIESLQCTLDDVDSFLSEAVSKDRLLCLRVADLLDNMFTSGASVVTITTSEAYQRKICYNAAAYYGVEHVVDGPTLFFRRVPTSHPDTRLRALLSRVATPAAAGPSKVIIARRQTSTSSFAAGGDRDDPSRSDSGRDSKSGLAQSIEEKQERYRQTRERIFGDFVSKAEEPLAPTPTPAPVTTQESQMKFPEVRAVRGAAPRSRGQGLWTPSSYSTDVRGSVSPASTRPLAAPVAPLLSFGAGSNVWSRSQQSSDQFGQGQGPPLVRPDMHMMGAGGGAGHPGGPGINSGHMGGQMGGHAIGMGMPPGMGGPHYMQQGYPPYPPHGYPPHYYSPMANMAPPMQMPGPRGPEPRRYPPMGYDQSMGSNGPQMHMHGPPMPHDYRMYPSQPW